MNYMMKNNLKKTLIVAVVALSFNLIAMETAVKNDTTAIVNDLISKGASINPEEVISCKHGPNAIISGHPTYVITHHKDDSVKLWDAKTGKLQATMEYEPGSIKSIRIEPDGKTITTTDTGNVTTKWDAKTGELISRSGSVGEPTIWTYTDETGKVTSYDDPKARTMTATHPDGTVNIYDLRTDEKLQ